MRLKQEVSEEVLFMKALSGKVYIASIKTGAISSKGMNFL